MQEKVNGQNERYEEVIEVFDVTKNKKKKKLNDIFKIKNFWNNGPRVVNLRMNKWICKYISWFQPILS